MPKITAKKIIDTLAADGFTWQLMGRKKDEIRTKQKYKGLCHCPLSAYLKLVHRVNVSSLEVPRIFTEEYGISEDIAACIVDIADNNYLLPEEKKLRTYMLKRFGLVEKEQGDKAP